MMHLRPQSSLHIKLTTINHTRYTQSRTLDAQPWELVGVGITSIAKLDWICTPRRPAELGLLRRKRRKCLYIHVSCICTYCKPIRFLIMLCTSHISSSHPPCTPSGHSGGDSVVNISCKHHIIMMDNDWLWLAMNIPPPAIWVLHHLSPWEGVALQGYQ